MREGTDPHLPNPGKCGPPSRWFVREGGNRPTFAKLRQMWGTQRRGSILHAEGDAMKGLFWLGLVVLVLGIASLFVAIPRSEREGIRAGNVDIGVQVKHNERVSPIITAVLVIGGASMMIAGGRGRGK